ncbi:signal recognition particle, SRP9/SRP14 subunit [Pterulicium gracile]|uniref:Signal recognition particle subunit SRP14 n=1 Tax=Pterulicium gracile TaxID=1884261 RepID=A0A5C3QPJ6_9AGAR|nr:signal recognition particle, SRP9/SRP14 subunit [Pterula gracilis]
MQLVDNDTFISQLTKLFESSSEHGTVWLTHKRFSYDDGDIKMDTADGGDDREYPCLLRATNGKEISFSTRVTPTDLAKFTAHYGSLLKAQMTPHLRKRDKNKQKAKQDQANARKARMTEPVLIEGSKRGAGRRKMQRRLKLVRKQNESQEAFRVRGEGKVVV